jgi:hypothetical protein
VHRDPLIFAFFLRGKANISGGGVFCVGTLIFFLRGSNFIDLVHRGGGCTLNGMAPASSPVALLVKFVGRGQRETLEDRVLIEGSEGNDFNFFRLPSMHHNRFFQPLVYIYLN